LHSSFLAPSEGLTGASRAARVARTYCKWKGPRFSRASSSELCSVLSRPITSSIDCFVDRFADRFTSREFAGKVLLSYFSESATRFVVIRSGLDAAGGLLEERPAPHPTPRPSLSPSPPSVSAQLLSAQLLPGGSIDVCTGDGDWSRRGKV